MFHPSPVGYFRLGVSAPRRELREGYRQQARRRHLHAVLIPNIPKAATDHGIGVERPLVTATLVRTDLGTGDDVPWLATVATDFALGREASPFVLELVVTTEGATGSEARALGITQFPTATDQGTGVASSLVVISIPQAATDSATGGDLGAVLPVNPVAATDGGTGAEAAITFSGIPRGATYRDQEALGRYQVGERIGLAVICVGPRGPVRPDATPLVRILSPGRTARGRQVPVDPTDRDTPSLFRADFTPGPDDGPGIYVAVFTYSVGGFAASSCTAFEVVPGGHPSGTVISQLAIPNPDSIALIAHTEAGRLLSGRGPYIDDGVD